MCCCAQMAINIYNSVYCPFIKAPSPRRVWTLMISPGGTKPQGCHSAKSWAIPASCALQNCSGLSGVHWQVLMLWSKGISGALNCRAKLDWFFLQGSQLWDNACGWNPLPWGETRANPRYPGSKFSVNPRCASSVTVQDFRAWPESWKFGVADAGRSLLLLLCRALSCCGCPAAAGLSCIGCTLGIKMQNSHWRFHKARWGWNGSREEEFISSFRVG